LHQQNNQQNPRTLLSIIIAAHNEEDVIEERISNILDTGSEDFDFEIIVMADGCTDGTVAKVRHLHTRDRPISVYETKSRGRANAHNEAHALAQGDILFFTDAETEYAPGFLDILGHAFDDQQVGFASGQLGWKNRDQQTAAAHFSLYWRFEIWLRKMETRLDIHALGTGACCAVRKPFYRPIPRQEDVDFTTPLDVVLQGKICVFVPEARAYDYAAATLSEEFPARVRMTAKNFNGTLRFFPAILRKWAGLTLIFHKIGRWLTPFFACVVLLTGTGLMALGEATLLQNILTVSVWTFIAAGLVGAFAPTLPIVGQIWSFLVSNAGFALGVIRSLQKKAPVSW